MPHPPLPRRSRDDPAGAVRRDARHRAPGVAVLALALSLAVVAGCASKPKGSISDLTVPPVSSIPTGSTPGAASGSVPSSTPASTPGSTPGSTSGGVPGSRPGTTQAEGPSSAAITTFTVAPRVTCDGAVDTELKLTYATSGATSVVVLVDGTQVPGAAPVQGPFTVPVACDGSIHTIVLTAVDAKGRPAVEAKAVATSTQPQGD